MSDGVGEKEIAASQPRDGAGDRRETIFITVAMMIPPSDNLPSLEVSHRVKTTCVGRKEDNVWCACDRELNDGSPVGVAAAASHYRGMITFVLPGKRYRVSLNK